MPVDVQTIYSPNYEQPGYTQGGAVFVQGVQGGHGYAPLPSAMIERQELPPPATTMAPPPRSLLPAPAPTARPAFMVSAWGNDIASARVRGHVEAERQLAGRGLQGPLNMAAESFADGTYTAVYEYGAPQAAVGVTASGASSATPSDATSPSTPQSEHTAAKPAWVLVLPIESRDNKPHWERTTDWAKAWLVPSRRDGMRFVATTGDADDHDHAPMAGNTTDDAAVSAILRKYAAPAVAIARFDPKSLTVGVEMWWRDGGHAQRDTEVGSAAAAKDAAAGLIAHLVADAATAPEASLSGSIVTIEADDGVNRVTIRVEASDQQAQDAARRSLHAVAGMSVRTVRGDAEGVEADVEWQGTEVALARALSAAGIRTSP